MQITLQICKSHYKYANYITHICKLHDEYTNYYKYSNIQTITRESVDVLRNEGVILVGDLGCVEQRTQCCLYRPNSGGKLQVHVPWRLTCMCMTSDQHVYDVRPACDWRHYHALLFIMYLFSLCFCIALS